MLAQPLHAAVLAAAGLLLAAATTAPAGQKAVSPHAAALTELRQIHTLLANANHDYNGHRAKAQHEVTKALHTLQHGPNHKHKKSPGKSAPRVKGPAVHEAQVVSDAQMQTAAKGITAVLARLGTRANDAHAAAAAPYLRDALNHINLGLQSVQKK